MEVEQYAASPDGTRFLFTTSEGAEGSLTLAIITNWPALLRQAATAR